MLIFLPYRKILFLIFKISPTIPQSFQPNTHIFNILFLLFRQYPFVLRISSQAEILYEGSHHQFRIESQNQMHQTIQFIN